MHQWHPSHSAPALRQEGFLESCLVALLLNGVRQPCRQSEAGAAQPKNGGQISTAGTRMPPTHTSNCKALHQGPCAQSPTCRPPAPRHLNVPSLISAPLHQMRIPPPARVLDVLLVVDIQNALSLPGVQAPAPDAATPFANTCCCEVRYTLSAGAVKW